MTQYYPVSLLQLLHAMMTFVLTDDVTPTIPANPADTGRRAQAPLELVRRLAMEDGQLQ